ncbi:MAG: MarR family transcriptional regulator [Bacteroidia bacterium]|nr:MarR family transcriptional regulator [Bacteroidia bacterium]
MKAIHGNIVEQPLGRVFSHIGKNYLHILNTELGHLDISRSYYVLLVIDNRNDTVTQQDLAGLLDTDKVSMVRIIDYLSDNGYVKRTRNQIDRRKYCLVLTQKAKKALPGIKNSIDNVNRIALKNLKPSQVEEFYNILEIIKNNLKSGSPLGVDHSVVRDSGKSVRK